MNFLQLAQRTFQEAAISGSLSATTLQTGESKRIVDWTATAYQDICRRHPSWEFLRSEFTFNTVANTQAYAVSSVTDTVASAAIAVAEFGYWRKDDQFRIYLTSAGVAAQTWLPFCPYDIFRDRWLFGAMGAQQPSCFSIRPRDKALVLGAKPDAIYTVTGDYQKAVQVLAVDADIPLMPDRFHMSIVWEAVKKYAGFEEDGGLYDHADREFEKLYTDLEENQLPQVDLALPLA